MIARVPHLVAGRDGQHRQRRTDRCTSTTLPGPGSTKNPKRVGRGIGGKGGKTAGRGTKGQHARNTVARGFEGGQMPLSSACPKLKGFNNPFRVEYHAINLDALGRARREDRRHAVDPEVLVTQGVVRKGDYVKVLARGELTPSSTSTPTPCRRPPRRRSPPRAVR